MIEKKFKAGEGAMHCIGLYIVIGVSEESKSRSGRGLELGDDSRRDVGHINSYVGVKNS